MTTCTTHKTIRVRYSAPVARCVRRLRVFPPASHGAQRVLNVRWRCEPAADRTREMRDDFGNRVLELCHRRITDEFLFAAEIVTQMEIVTRVDVDAAAGTAQDTMSGAARDENLPPAGLTAFLLPSPLCEIPDEVQRIVGHMQSKRQVGGASPSDVQRSAERLCAWAHGALRYAPGLTGPRTTVRQALALGGGVCQDYAHLLIALCRAARIPARYVSGYLPGEGLMHAWVEVLCGEQWRAFDPTHNRMASDNCVFVACGRDYADVAPITGSYAGDAVAQLKTKCETRVEK